MVSRTKVHLSPSKVTSVLLKDESDFLDVNKSLADFSTIFGIGVVVFVAVVVVDADGEPKEKTSLSCRPPNEKNLFSFMPYEDEECIEFFLSAEVPKPLLPGLTPFRDGVSDFRANESRLAPARSFDATPLLHGDDLAPEIAPKVEE